MNQMVEYFLHNLPIKREREKKLINNFICLKTFDNGK